MCWNDVHRTRSLFGELDVRATNNLGESVLDDKWIHGSWYGEASETKINITTETTLTITRILYISLICCIYDCVNMLTLLIRILFRRLETILQHPP